MAVGGECQKMVCTACCHIIYHWYIFGLFLFLSFLFIIVVIVFTGLAIIRTEAYVPQISHCVALTWLKSFFVLKL